MNSLLMMAFFASLRILKVTGRLVPGFPGMQEGYIEGTRGILVPGAGRISNAQRSRIMETANERSAT